MHMPGTSFTETVTVLSIIYSSTLTEVIPRLGKLMNTINVPVPVVHVEELLILFLISVIMSSSLVVWSARPSL